jgi:non-specific serine/threonine protein kinase
LQAFTRAAWLAAVHGDRELCVAYSRQALAISLPVDTEAVRSERRTAQSFLIGSHEELRELNIRDRQLLAEGDIAPEGRVSLLHALAVRMPWVGQSGEALELVREAMAICQQHGDEWYLSFCRCLEAGRLTEMGRHEEALDAVRSALDLARDGFNSYSVAYALEFAAQVYSSLDRAAEAAVLFGALRAVWPRLGATLLVEDEAQHLAREEHARRLLGEERYARAFERGRRMTVDDVVAFVLGQEPAPEPQPPPNVQVVTAELTRRELEVADLIARGLSNKEIARTLVISPRTAEGHVTHLLDKLGFASRARVASWVAERRAARR